MSKNYRLRTTPGIDKDIKIKIDQDFDFIEVLSLKLKQSDVYTRFCADYGVIAGRVIANGGYGVPNVSVSVFVPLSDEDAEELASSLHKGIKTDLFIKNTRSKTPLVQLVPPGPYAFIQS